MNRKHLALVLALGPTAVLLLAFWVPDAWSLFWMDVTKWKHEITTAIMQSFVA